MACQFSPQRAAGIANGCASPKSHPLLVSCLPLRTAALQASSFRAVSGCAPFKVLSELLTCMQAVQYSVLALLLTLAGLHTLLFRGGGHYTAPGCPAEAAHAAKLDKSLLVGIQQLRYEQRLLQADRDRLLGTGFSQVHYFIRFDPIAASASVGELRARC